MAPDALAPCERTSCFSSPIEASKRLSLSARRGGRQARAGGRSMGAGVGRWLSWAVRHARVGSAPGRAALKRTVSSASNDAFVMPCRQLSPGSGPPEGPPIVTPSTAQHHTHDVSAHGGVAQSHSRGARCSPSAGAHSCSSTSGGGARRAESCVAWQMRRHALNFTPGSSFRAVRACARVNVTGPGGGVGSRTTSSTMRARRCSSNFGSSFAPCPVTSAQVRQVQKPKKNSNPCHSPHASR
eukprot:7388462-Prymnesium_polylepis.1